MSAVISAAVLTGCRGHPSRLRPAVRKRKICRVVQKVRPGLHRPGRRRSSRKWAIRTPRAAPCSQAGVPIVPGCDVVRDAEQAKQEAEKIGFPLLIKARAGGGGRGIRRVDSADEVERAFLAASSEAQAAFGDGACYMEKFLFPVKHIEMQLLCDHFGNIVCLGERECSMQRKNQKTLEESPSPSVDERNPKGNDARVRAGGKDRRLPGTWHHRVFAHAGQKILFHGDEHPLAGGASRHRNGHGLRSGQMADPRGGRAWS